MSQVKEDVIVQCFVDNHPSKQNTLFKGLRVISPDGLSDIAYDCIVIASQYSYDIMNQLMRMGIPHEKIVPYHYSYHNRMIEKYHKATIDQITSVVE